MPIQYSMYVCSMCPNWPWTDLFQMTFQFKSWRQNPWSLFFVVANNAFLSSAEAHMRLSEFQLVSRRSGGTDSCFFKSIQLSTRVAFHSCMYTFTHFYAASLFSLFVLRRQYNYSCCVLGCECCHKRSLSKFNTAPERSLCRRYRRTDATVSLSLSV